MKQTLASLPQPAPTPHTGLVVLSQVIRDLEERAEAGERKYGVKLQAYNGRDALWDAYQEALDLCMYLRQAIIEREHGNLPV